MDNLFSGLEDLGFKDLNKIELYEQQGENSGGNGGKEAKKDNPAEYLYDKSYTCPVCENTFKARAIRSGKTRPISQDADLMTRYEPIEPLFYDVIICPHCGYSALTSYFEKLKQDQILLIKSKITPNFKYKEYPEVYDADIAIERYKLALLNAVVKNARISEKAYICKKIAWVYRLKEDKENEIKFLTQAYIGFKEAFTKEIFPICGMDSFTYMYMLGAFCKMLGNPDEALLWLGKVITGRNVNPKLKELARDQKDLIKESSNS